MDFREWLNLQKNVHKETPPKVWKAKKDDIVTFWKGLDNTAPLALSPISYEHKGSTYNEDGIRITGSKEFINSVLARLKEFLTFENPKSKLSLVYRAVPAKGLTSRNSFVFYAQARERSLRHKKV